ncbi:MAG: response regulator [Gammaproteobacteria bacterium]|nr:response regulator [Gammaproteobacteria bacterium]
MTSDVVSTPYELPKNKRILAVDDDPGILDAYIHLLQPREQRFSKLKAMMGTPVLTDASFELSIAQQGAAAIELIKESSQKKLPYAAAFIDMRMPPGMNGLATAKAIRAIDGRIFVVIVTAYSDHSIDEIYRELERDVLLLRKPFAEDELLQTARTSIDIWNRECHRVRQLDAAKKRGKLLEQNLFSGAVRAHKTREKKPRAHLSFLEDVPRVILLDPDRTMLAKLRRAFPQITQYVSFASSAFRRQRPPELLIARIDEDHSRRQRQLFEWMRERRYDTAFLLYGTGATTRVRTHLLRGALVDILPENSHEHLLAHSAQRLFELRACAYELSDPDWPLLGNTKAFKQALRDARKMAVVGQPVLLRGHAFDVAAVARYMHRMSAVPGPLKVLSSAVFVHCQSVTDVGHAFAQAMLKNVSAGLLIENIDSLATELSQALIQNVRAHGIELILCGSARAAAVADVANFEPFVIDIPAVAERHDDWRLLIDYFVLQYVLRTGEPHYLDQADIDVIGGKPITDLHHLRQAVFARLASKEAAEVHLPVKTEPLPPRVLADHINQIEAAVIAQTLKDCDGNISKAARLLGTRPNTLHYRLKRHGIEYKK